MVRRKIFFRNVNWAKLCGALALCLGAGGIGSVFTTPVIPTWYAGLNKPEFSPPNFIFAPVWTTLFILMAVALYLIWQKGWQNKAARTGMIIFVIHLFFNTLWSILFFALHNPFLALLDIIILWLLIIVLMIKFYALDKRAGYLLIPYFLWVSFASVLNYFIFILN
ncbi:MAG: TspO/MBR family protein [Patescibacteria group bacterium]